MEKYIIIKNGLVLTLDRACQTGYFNIIIKNNRIFLIDYERKFNEKEFRSKNPDAEIFDARDKLIMPGFFNSKLISSYSLNKIFFRKCSYQNIHSWHSLRLIENYLSGIENAETLRDLLKISYLISLRNGETFMNESSPVIGKDFSDIYLTDLDWINQYYNLTAYDFKIPARQEGNVSFGFITDENINNYSLTSIKRNLSGNKVNLFISAALSEKTFESIKKVFGKPFISVLSEMELISGHTIISNPTHLNPAELDILKQKKATILISPSDYINLSYRKVEIDELILSGVNIIIGTGYTGTDILSELKILSNLVSKNNLSSENLLRMAIQNPAMVFGISNLTGSIERNRSADMIFFDLKDIRNSMTLPDTDSENVIDFLLQKLNTKDISDVILKGEFMVKDGEFKIEKFESPDVRVKEISQKINSAGKYSEYKEKYLMRGRVDKLGLENEVPADEEKAEIFVDMIETGEYAGEGEFVILGAKEEEFEKPRSRDIEKVQTDINLREIKSLERDMNLFEGIEELPEIQKPLKKKKPAEKVLPEAIETGEKLAAGEVKDSEDTFKTDENNADAGKDVVDTAEPQKSKLKFGFSDGD